MIIKLKTLSITSYFKQLSLNQIIFLLLVFFAFGSSIFSALVDTQDRTTEWWSGWSQNFSTEMFGAIMTFVLFELLVGSRKEREAEQRRQARKARELQARLRREAKSDINIVAVQAVNDIREHDWLWDGNGILKDANLYNANLQGVNLRVANLESAGLYQANLINADLSWANLTDAELNSANLKNANLQEAILKGADLGSANLQNANLTETDLSSADLYNTNLEGAQLLDAIFDRKTVLPDAERIGEDSNGNSIYDKYWRPDTDMTAYTDPRHPEFWQPQWVNFR